MEIAEDKLYRIVKLINGQYAGQYRVYWNKHIWSLFEADADIYTWGDKECLETQAGDWIETYDGTVIQCLKVRQYKDKKGRIYHYFSFPIATVYSWTNKDGKTQFRQFQGNFMNGNRNTMATSYMGTNNQKVRFASLIAGGLNPFKAYRVAYTNYKSMSIHILHRKVNQLMSDEIVRIELRNQLMPLAEKLNDQFNDNRLIKELDLLLSNSRKGSDAHRENIKFIMALVNKLPDAMYSGGKGNKKIAVNAEFEEMTVPQLGQAPSIE